MMKGRGDGRIEEGFLYLENSLVCRCSGCTCKECLVFTVFQTLDHHAAYIPFAINDTQKSVM